MEAVTALSLASAVVQLVDFGGRVFSASAEIRKSATGLTNELEDIEATSTDLQALARTFELGSGTPSANSSDAEKSLSDLARTCATLTADLLGAVSKIKVAQSGKHERWRTLRQAFRALLKNDEIRALARRLEALKSELVLRLAQLGRDEQSAIHTVLVNYIRASEEARNNNTGELQHVKLALVDQTAKQSADLGALRSIVLSRLDQQQEAAITVREQTDQRVKQILDAATETLQNTRNMCHEASVYQRLIASLQYPEIRIRHSQIPKPYKDTFSWIIDSAPFRPWLERSGGVFWINGKAGSGKSTLMKYLADDPDIIVVLSKWAGDKALILASFFFWATGKPLQRSREGLLRSLLCQILRQCPELIPEVCPEEQLAKCATSHFPNAFEISWTCAELIRTIGLIVSLDDVAGRFCFFIDGLDEYDGDHYDLIRLLADLGASSAIKICVSSRPWNVFRKAYEERPDRCLVLQDHTRQDIDTFIRGTLEQDVRFKELAANDAAAHAIIEETRIKAQGVFLWVFLVVRSLLRGFADDDDLDVLLQRLREIPCTLEEYFNKMLCSLDTVYQRYTARSLLVAIVAETPLPLLSYWYLQLDMTDPDYALRAELEMFTDQMLDQKWRIAMFNVNKGCRDLLEVLPSHGVKQRIFARQVVFLHRTVREYLLRDDIQARLWRSTGTDFRPELVLARLYLRHAKTIDRSSSTQQDEFALVAARLMHKARLYELRASRCCKDLIIDLDTVGRAIRPNTSHWTDFHLLNAVDPYTALEKGAWSVLSPTNERHSDARDFIHTSQSALTDSDDFPIDRRNEARTLKSIRLHRKRNLIAFAVEFDLLLFVKEWLRDHPQDIRKPEGAALLYHALSPVLPIELLGTQQRNPLKMIDLLLRAGADPNEEVWSWDGDTVWEKVVRSTTPSEPDSNGPITLEDHRESAMVSGDDYNIRQLFSPLSESPEDAYNHRSHRSDADRSAVEDLYTLFELIQYHANADQQDYQQLMPGRNS